jgi:hypothetical protein
MKKSELLELLRDEPEDLDVAKLVYTLYLRRRAELGLTVTDAEQDYSPEQFAELEREWTVAGYDPRRPFGRHGA